eukprot:365219-Chlamydomonas_euryale.AAC.11
MQISGQKICPRPAICATMFWLQARFLAKHQLCHAVYVLKISETAHCCATASVFQAAALSPRKRQQQQLHVHQPNPRLLKQPSTSQHKRVAVAAQVPESNGFMQTSLAQNIHTDRPLADIQASMSPCSEAVWRPVSQCRHCGKYDTHLGTGILQLPGTQLRCIQVPYTRPAALLHFNQGQQWIFCIHGGHASVPSMRAA